MKWALLFLAACGAKSVDASKITASPLLPALDDATRCPDVDACEKACDAKDARACENLGNKLAYGANVALAPDRAARLFSKGCDAGRPSSCAALGLLYQDGRGVAESDSRAATLYDFACTHGAGVGCFNLALMHADGPLDLDANKVSELMHAAEPLYRKQCSEGDLAWCINLGVLYDNGMVGKRDGVRAADAYREACWGGYAEACANWALMFLEQPESTAFASRLLEHACRAKSALACGVLGQALYVGRGVKEDGARAAELLKQGCDGGDGNACGILGAVLSLGDKVPKDLKAGHDAEERGCALGSAQACMSIGAEGMEAHDVAMGQSGFERACMIGDGEACWMIANLRAQNAIEPRGEAAAMVKMRESCSLRYRAACIILLASGEQPPVPDADLPALRADACKAGVKAFCTQAVPASP
ncbi:MAG TPA: hypothetical protein VL463_14645 [Kofleriaceae bacterium]|jgi:TPR repeat protein|nr:hypothetical protein [Kofleriaceae bacterium]